MAKLNDQNVVVYDGDDFALRVTLKDDAGAAVDLTTFNSLTWEVAKKVKGAAFITKTDADGIEVQSPTTAGIVVITLLPTDTRGKAGEYRHEMQLVDSDGKYHTIMVGKLTVLPTIIQET